MGAFCIFVDRKPEGRIFTFLFHLALLELLCGLVTALTERGFLAFTRPAPRFCSYFAFVLIFYAYA